MAFSYPEFYGRNDENVADFLEKMELACISNHVEAPAQVLRLLQICLKGEARAWARTYETGLQALEPPVALTLENLREALVAEFVSVVDPDKVWQEIQRLVQRNDKPIDDYIKRFSSLWEDMCRALLP